MAAVAATNRRTAINRPPQCLCRGWGSSYCTTQPNHKRVKNNSSHKNALREKVVWGRGVGQGYYTFVIIWEKIKTSNKIRIEGIEIVPMVGKSNWEAGINRTQIGQGSARIRIINSFLKTKKLIWFSKGKIRELFKEEWKDFSRAERRKGNILKRTTLKTSYIISLLKISIYLPLLKSQTISSPILPFRNPSTFKVPMTSSFATQM